MIEKRKEIIISIILVCIIILGFFLLSPIFKSSEKKFSLKAVIIDQLSIEKTLSNPNFTSTVTKILENAGFTVEHYEGEEVTVNFFKELAKNNYGIIILRVHSALRNDSSTVDLFTAEKFDPSIHSQELEEGLVIRGLLNYPSGTKEYFAITSKFIENLEGSFPKSVVIAMGCWSLKPKCEQLAKAFIEKGATIYIGWNGMVSPNHTDKETVSLLKKLLEENKTISEAVNHVSSDPTYNSFMSYYPKRNGNLKLSSLIAEVKFNVKESNFSLFTNYFERSKTFRLNVSLSGLTLFYSSFPRFILYYPHKQFVK